MFKFNNEGIFTGYIKQLLSSFNLPKYRVYTQEQRTYHEKYLANYNNHIKKIENLEGEIKLLKAIQSSTLATAEDKAAAAEARTKAEAELKAEKAITPELNVFSTIYRNDAPDYDDLNTASIEWSSGSGQTPATGTPTEGGVDYPIRMRYMPYIKDGKIQEYVPEVTDDGEVKYSPNDWKICHAQFDLHHSALHNTPNSNNALKTKNYIFGLQDLNYTKTLRIQNNIYDSYTHEYLGDYLRFLRDYNDINLMPLYNCFSNRVCPKLDLEFTVGNSSYKARFNTDDADYKIYMIPIKLFKTYTIAIDCNAAVEMCCGLFGQYQQEEKKYLPISKNTYACFNDLQFRTPVLYDKTLALNEFLSSDDETELAQHEGILKLFIKVPFNNESSIVVLEGDYTGYNDTFLLSHTIDKNIGTTKAAYNFQSEIIKMPSKDGMRPANYSDIVSIGSYLYEYLVRPFIQEIEDPSADYSKRELAKSIINEYPTKCIEYYEDLVSGGILEKDRIEHVPLINRETLNKIKGYADKLFGAGGVEGLNTELINRLKSLEQTTIRATNHTIINFDSDYSEQVKHLITPLQLLRTNTGISYPFADRLIEYLIGNAITPLDEIYDNVERAKTVTKVNTNEAIVPIEEDGLWSVALQAIYYNYINENKNTNDINHDILGFVDKDVERWYGYTELVKASLKNKKDYEKTTTISSVNIYDEWEDAYDESTED